ncbi:iron complex outermembrane recepter protein [Chishuiella changwenlii]|uniref:Iron complex outermembrane recepter protein n=1 Tax=Chishuiella changwenlii TaxID=1434701 RepID=A0A1M6V0E4_9FLAO|nr:TonB-dependent receptor [Chishuiella changwenlii]GGF02237.1 TonB-dependent receptor [Chishuiella changwenlii]SHK74786.1 iron complex outermembrane recepter protein [Chishuiella changwenlii]
MKKAIFKISLLLSVTVTNIKFIHAQETTPKPIINDSIIGTVIDTNTKEPLVGVKIQLEGVTHQTKTDTNGEFKFITGQKLPINIIVSHQDYEKRTITVQSNETIIELSPPFENLNQVLVTSRRRKEKIQEVPIPISTIKGAALEEAGAFNVNRLKEIVPTVQLYSSNARNTTLNIRGLGSTYGLTNDGIDPGVGFYLDGVYIARPAATWLDFIDIEQIEVLRGPQGTLFGKNTTAGAFNITSRLPKFSPEANVEVSYGNLGFIQAKTSVTGPLAKNLAGRISFSGTQRDGNLYNVYTNRKINDINNLGFRGQLLFTPTKDIKLVLSGDYSAQKPDGYGWAVAGVVKTQRADYRQFDAIIKDLGYEIPYKNAFERKIDLDTQSKADNKLGGIALNADIKIGNGTLTSTSAWRHWKWDPLNDRDYLGIPVYTVSSGNSVHDQWSQEFRYSGKINEKITGVVGVYGLWQDLRTDPVHIEEAGSALWRFQQNSDSPLWQTPRLFDGFGIKTKYGIKSTSLAVYTQIDWNPLSKLHILPGIRYNYDKKTANYDRQTYGGLETNDPALIALKNGVYTNQTFNVNADADNWSGQLSVQYKFTSNWNAYATYSISYKPIGVNVGGLPTSNGQVMLDLAQVKPETVNHFEAGFKSNPTRNSLLNVTFYQSNINDYQTQVQTPEPGVNRGYLANAEKVRVRGIELDGNISLYKFLKINGAIAYTDAKYVKFTNAPVPLEEVGGSQAFKDVSGGVLPGVSKWSWSLGTEATKRGKLIGLNGSYFIGADVFHRSDFSSSSSPSKYLNIDGYTLLNARLGFRGSNGISIFIWSRNLTNKDYYEQLLAAPGSYGQYAGVIADPRTYGITFRYNFKQ